MSSRTGVVRGVAIKRQYGVMTAREVLLEKVKLRAALALFVVAEEKDNIEKK